MPTIAEEIALELARIERAALQRIRERMAAAQQGEAFQQEHPDAHR